jgi:hypothetical protein
LADGFVSDLLLLGFRTDNSARSGFDTRNISAAAKRITSAVSTTTTADRYRLDAVPELNAMLPPTAIGKDYPDRGA